MALITVALIRKLSLEERARSWALIPFIF